MTRIPEIRLFRALKANFPAWRQGAIERFEAQQREYDSHVAARALYVLRNDSAAAARMYLDMLHEDRARWRDCRDRGHRTLTDCEGGSFYLTCREWKA